MPGTVTAKMQPFNHPRAAALPKMIKVGLPLRPDRPTLRVTRPLHDCAHDQRLATRPPVGRALVPECSHARSHQNGSSRRSDVCDALNMRQIRESAVHADGRFSDLAVTCLNNRSSVEVGQGRSRRRLGPQGSSRTSARSCRMADVGAVDGYAVTRICIGRGARSNT